jgi:ribosome-binding factor A
MSGRRIERINSLLKEVLSDVIRREVKNPHLPQLITVTHVDVTRDLRHAKVYVSVIGEDAVKSEAIDVLQSASGFIGVQASKQVALRYFPELNFILDDSVDQQMRIDRLVADIQAEREIREHE